MASSKTAVRVSHLALVSGTSGMAWVTILGDDNPTSPNAVTIKMPSQKDLLISVSLECGLYTNTLVKSKGGISDTSQAMGAIQVRALVDGRPADPGEVVFSRRSQTLTATLQGIIGNLACFPDGVFNPDAPGCVLTEEQVGLVLDTLDANGFIFALANVGVGNHNIVVQASVQTSTSTQSGSASAQALIGKGSLVVDDVRLIKSGVIDLS